MDILEDYRSKEDLRKKNAIAELLTAADIQITDRPLNWEEAFRLSAGPLIQAGAIEETYVEQAIENVREYGDYVIVSKGVVLVHAQKEYGVHRDCLNLLVAKSGALFEESGETANLIFCFANQGDKKYLDLLRSIIRLGRIEGRIEKICSLGCSEDVYREIVYDLD